MGPYLLTERVGRGGMAEVFTAIAQQGAPDRARSRAVVVKRVLPQLSEETQVLKMFREEMALAPLLRHPNLVQVLDSGESDGVPYLVMEHVAGRDLQQVLVACGNQRVGFPTDVAIYVVVSLLRALEYAHALRDPRGEPLGIIHRDVTPNNVLLAFDGRVKLLDFGVAKANGREPTAHGILKGKLGYLTPEQVTGRAVDHRSDIFSTGIVLYELLTGRRLFKGKSELEVLEKIRFATIELTPRARRPELPAELEGVVLRALSRDPADRFQTATDMRMTLEVAADTHQIRLKPGRVAALLGRLFPDAARAAERVDEETSPSVGALLEKIDQELDRASLDGDLTYQDEDSQSLEGERATFCEPTKASTSAPPRGESALWSADVPLLAAPAAEPGEFDATEVPSEIIDLSSDRWVVRSEDELAAPRITPPRSGSQTAPMEPVSRIASAVRVTPAVLPAPSVPPARPAPSVPPARPVSSTPPQAISSPPAPSPPTPPRIPITVAGPHQGPPSAIATPLPPSSPVALKAAAALVLALLAAATLLFFPRDRLRAALGLDSAPRARPAQGQGSLQVTCAEPVTVVIEPLGGRYLRVRRLDLELPVGEYQLVFEHTSGAKESVPLRLTHAALTTAECASR